MSFKTNLYGSQPQRKYSKPNQSRSTYVKSESKPVVVSAPPVTEVTPPQYNGSDKRYFEATIIKEDLLKKLTSENTSKEVLLERIVSMRNRLWHLRKSNNFSTLGQEAYSDQSFNILTNLPDSFNNHPHNMKDYSSEYHNPAKLATDPVISFKISDFYSGKSSSLAKETLSASSFNSKLYRNYNSLIYEYSSILNSIIGSLTPSMEDPILDNTVAISPLSILSDVNQPSNMEVIYSGLSSDAMKSQMTIMRRNLDIMRELINTLSLIASNGYTDVNLVHTNYQCSDSTASVMLTNQALNNYNISQSQYYSLLINVVLCSVLQMSVNSVVITKEYYDRVKVTLSAYYTKIFNMALNRENKNFTVYTSKTFIGCSVACSYLNDAYFTCNSSFAIVKKSPAFFFDTCIIPNTTTSFSVNNSGYDAIGWFEVGGGQFSYLSTLTFNSEHTLVNQFPNFNYYSTLFNYISNNLSSSNGISAISYSPYGEPSDPSQTSFSLNIPTVLNSAKMCINLMGSSWFVDPSFPRALSIASPSNPTVSSTAYAITEQIVPSPQSYSDPYISSSASNSYYQDDYPDAMTVPPSVASINATTNDNIQLTATTPLPEKYQALAASHGKIMAFVNNLVLNGKSFLNGSDSKLNPIYIALQNITNALESTEEPVFDELSYSTTMYHSINFKDLTELVNTVYQYIDNNKATTKASLPYSKQSRISYFQKYFSVLNSDDANLKLTVSLNLGGKQTFFTNQELPEKFKSPRYNMISYEFCQFLRVISSLSNDMHPELKQYVNKILS